MIAAIYARKSTEQNGVSNEEKSVTRQIEHAKAYAAGKGWIVAEEHIYSDDGISGATFGDQRPGLLRLMNALKPTPPFQVLIMSEDSRLGRDRILTEYTLMGIIEAGVKVFYYLTDQEACMDDATSSFMQSVKLYAAQMEREKASQRTHDAMLKKARSGFVVGNRVFGYDNLTVYGDEHNGERKRLHVVRRINEHEAVIVRRIFTLYATGSGLDGIAKALNAEGVQPPTKRRAGWAPSCVREILHRQLYRGLVIWNKTQAIHRGGTQRSRKRPESEWLKIEEPDLRIVPEDVWKQVAGQLTRTRALYARSARGRLLGRPSSADMQSEYLLSGLANCALCGGSIACQKRGKAKHTYMCVYHHNRGPEVCPNGLHISMLVLDAAVLDAIRAALDHRLLAEAVQRALVELRTGQAKIPADRLAIERQLSLVEARLRHLVEAIASGKATEPVYAELQKEEAAKKALTGRLAVLDHLTRIASLDGKRIERTLIERVSDVKSLLGRHIPQTRQMLRKLVPGRIVCAPFDDTRGRGYSLSASGSYAGLLSEKVLVNHGGGGEGS